MSAIYSVMPVVYYGWVISIEEFLEEFCEMRGERTRMEDRYDPKTGEKVEPVEVVIAEGGHYFNGQLLKDYTDQIQDWIDEHFQQKECEFKVSSMYDEDGDWNNLCFGIEVDGLTLDKVDAAMIPFVDFARNELKRTEDPVLCVFCLDCYS